MVRAAQFDSLVRTTGGTRRRERVKRSRAGTNDPERSGKPKDVNTREIIEKIHDIVLDDPKVKVRELADTTSISIGLVVKIFHEDLDMRKPTAKWAQPLLSTNQNGYEFLIQRVV